MNQRWPGREQTDNEIGAYDSKNDRHMRFSGQPFIFNLKMQQTHMQSNVGIRHEGDYELIFGAFKVH